MCLKIILKVTKLDFCKIGNDFISRNDKRYNQSGQFTEANFI